ncbi:MULTISPECIES: methylenetetrahydrofolate reductase [NAD(P)H] [unclassified Rhizobium]|uniref:methylenetetrahydrofolate reductase [NAD(P)H] n=1 Tax=unclassified Rhizobium TaxID=2613769 RepID=UPI000CDF46B4|nr:MULTISPECIES: methylenetetrahydrofolate reductase [NAD(P)H] [Rhizobium]AVA22130.1 5,10-methylenetetrahydrofolate reductase [Rhizobium sp. NXC24]MDK4738003.1 methylenetetrahydrofolate reductase [NAD(P)H] [Rhizobium sp. CNPSo 3464]UWU23181.1 methylenetetrahydrofolate reductase [NAD(P)H] [Rhizobium tropici]
MPSKTENGQRGIRISFEFFPPKSDEAETQLWNTVADLAEWDADFVSVTYGAGGSTKAPTLSAVRRMIHETPFSTASHLTCVGATREETHRVIDDLLAAGTRRFVALRGDPPGGVGSAYQPHPGGYANAAELVLALRERGDFDISVSAYPEKHPESRDTAADIDMLKRKADNGANRALTQFFFDNDAFERYHDRVRAAGIKIPVVPGIMPIQNLTQLKRFAGACGTNIPSWLDERFDGLDEQADKRANVAADVAAEQIEDLVRRGIHEFHLYTMNRSPLVSAVLERLGIQRRADARAGAAA